MFETWTEWAEEYRKKHRNKLLKMQGMDSLRGKLKTNEEFPMKLGGAE